MGRVYSVLLLQRWLILVAGFRLFAVYLGYFAPDKFQIALIDRQPELANELYGRLFSTWTLLTCTLCVICARDPTNPAIYGATLVSFLVALSYMLLELLVFKTMSIKGAASPLVIAGLSSLWMGAGWNYYTKYCVTGEEPPTPTMNGSASPSALKDE